MYKPFKNPLNPLKKPIEIKEIYNPINPMMYNSNIGELQRLSNPMPMFYYSSNPDPNDCDETPHSIGDVVTQIAGSIIRGIAESNR